MFLHVEVYGGDCSYVQTEGKTVILLNVRTHSSFEENWSFTTGIKVQGPSVCRTKEGAQSEKNKLAKAFME